MVSEFEQGLAIALEDGYVVSEGGMEYIYSVFKHLSEGGTVETFPEASEPMEVSIILGVVYNTLQKYVAQVD